MTFLGVTEYLIKMNKAFCFAIFTTKSITNAEAPYFDLTLSHISHLSKWFMFVRSSWIFVLKVWNEIPAQINDQRTFSALQMRKIIARCFWRQRITRESKITSKIGHIISYTVNFLNFQLGNRQRKVNAAQRSQTARNINTLFNIKQELCFCTRKPTLNLCFYRDGGKT
jgi:hypothetical protein